MSFRAHSRQLEIFLEGGEYWDASFCHGRGAIILLDLEQKHYIQNLSTPFSYTAEDEARRRGNVDQE